MPAPLPFKNTCPCTILPPPFFNFSESPPSRGGNQNLPPPFKKYAHVQTMLINRDFLFFDKDFSKIKFFANQMGLLALDFNKINLDDGNDFDEDDPETIIHVRL